MTMGDGHYWKGERAYVALLHGQEQEFFLYSLVLGHCIRTLDEQTPRLLLIGRSLPDYASPFLESPARQILETMWQICEVDLIDCPQADKTSSKRHRFVFSKLRAFEVPFFHITFFDLDVVVLHPPREFFQVEGPAAMHSGEWNRENAEHGGVIPPKEFYDGEWKGCVNAGLMRLDPLYYTKEWLKQLHDKVLCLTWKDQSYLPEQYFLVEHLQGWRHIDVSWNWEVYPEWFVAWTDDHGVRRKMGMDDMEVRSAEMNKDWWDRAKKRQIKMLHFSGTWIHPWWYIHLTPLDAKKKIESTYAQRDPGGMLAWAVSIWLSTLHGCLETLEMTVTSRQMTYVNDVIDQVKRRVECWWDDDSECGTDGCFGYKTKTGLCEECIVRSELKKPDVSSVTVPGNNNKRFRSKVGDGTGSCDTQLADPGIGRCFNRGHDISGGSHGCTRPDAGEWRVVHGTGELPREGNIGGSAGNTWSHGSALSAIGGYPSGSEWFAAGDSGKEESSLGRMSHDMM